MRPSRLRRPRFRPVRPFLIVSAALAAGCAGVPDTSPTPLEEGLRACHLGQIERGLDAYGRAVGEPAGDPADAGAWSRALILYSLHKVGGWERIEARYGTRSSGWAKLAESLRAEAAGGDLLGAALVSLHEARFHEQSGRWGRLPAWARPELLALCGDGFLRRAEAPAAVLEPPGDDVPVLIADLLGRASLARTAATFHLRAWELAAASPDLPERDCRVRFEAAARLSANFTRELARLAPHAAHRERLTADADQWDRRAHAAEEGAPREFVGLAADEEFVSATAQDHFESGAQAFGLAVEEAASRGMPGAAGLRRRQVLDHLLAAREFKGPLTRDEESRLDYLEPAVRGLYRLMMGGN